MPRGARPGERRGGRAKGTPNKLTADIKSTIIEAFEKLGGVEYLQEVGRKDPKVFCALLGRVLPHDLNHSGAVGSYAAQPIPVEQRDSDALASPAGTTALGHSNGHGR